MHTAYIGMGGNLASWAGPPASTLAAAVHRLQSLGRVVSRSSLYMTEPVGFRDQPLFINAAVELETPLAPRPLLDELLAIEKECGRDRSAAIPNGPRTLDLDILLFDDLVIREPGLEIPHPRLAGRAFVLVPLNEIAPNILDPGSGESVSQLLLSLDSFSTSETHAVVKIQNGAWRPGADRADAGPDKP